MPNIFRPRIRSFLLGALAAAACVTHAATEAPPRTEDVTIRILGSALDRGEIKPCG